MGERGVRGVLGVLVLLVAATGCARGEACAGWGTVAGVGVMFRQAGHGDLTGAVAELCARGECVRSRLREEEITRVNLRLPEDVDPDAGTVRLRVTPAGAARPVIDASATVPLTLQSDGCGGGSCNRGLALTGDGVLTTKIPRSLAEDWSAQIRGRATAPSR
ncbi:hypothetical protein ABZW47_05225 [Streptomyces sp. NPDC004549]|uniref:hypothetical protein n=1 Tax=Streptomyces sp. NPDC004549 TaxID=3154283 RepID=UPI0033BDDD9F